jgi:hypothetical protein
MTKNLTPRAAIEALGGYQIVLFATCLGLAASGLALALWLTGSRPGPALPVLALGALAFLGERRSIRINGSIEVSVSFLPLVFAAVLFGPLAAMVVGAMGLLSQFTMPYVRWLVWTSSRALAGGAAGLAAWSIAGHDSAEFRLLLAAAALASTAEVLADLMLNCATAKVRGTVALRDVLRTHAPIIVVAVPLYAPIVAVLAYTYQQASPWSVFLFLIPAFAAQRLFLLYR